MGCLGVVGASLGGDFNGFVEFLSRMVDPMPTKKHLVLRGAPILSFVTKKKTAYSPNKKTYSHGLPPSILADGSTAG